MQTVKIKGKTSQTKQGRKKKRRGACFFVRNSLPVKDWHQIEDGWTDKVREKYCIEMHAKKNEYRSNNFQ